MLRDLESKLTAVGGEELGGGIDGEFRINMYTLLCLKWITSSDLLNSTGN